MDGPHRATGEAHRVHGRNARASPARRTRRDLIKMGLFTAAGMLAPIGGLNPFVKSAYGQAPTGLPPTPLFACKEFTDPMPRFDVLPRTPVSSLNPQPTAEANQKMRAVQPALGGGYGPIEGRPPGPTWAHQRFSTHPPQVAVEVRQGQASTDHN